MNKKFKAVLQSYLYAGFSAAAALWMSGVTDWKTLATAAVTAIIGPLLQAINPKDTTLGVGAKKSND